MVLNSLHRAVKILLIHHAIWQNISFASPRQYLTMADVSSEAFVFICELVATSELASICISARCFFLISLTSLAFKHRHTDHYHVIIVITIIIIITVVV